MTVKVQRLFLPNPQTFLCHIHDLLSYAGQYILYGTALSHALWMPATVGHIRVPPRAVCGVILPKTPVRCALELTELLRGVPWGIVLESGTVPLVNGERRYLGSPGLTRDCMVERARRIIDIYHHWTLSGRLPPWYMDMVAAAQNKLNGR